MEMNENVNAERTRPPEAQEASGVPDDVLKKIKIAWIAGCVSGGVTLTGALLALAGDNYLGFSAWDLLDVVLICGLVYGIYRKSRICAVLMLLYFIVSKIVIIRETGSPAGLALALVFIYYYIQGVIGTFRYHNLLRRTRLSALQSVR